jgi:hypothetical protein
MKICPKCNTEHEKSGTFCSRKCSNSRGPRSDDFKRVVGAKLRAPPNTACTTCSTPLRRRPSDIAASGRAFCSLACMPRAVNFGKRMVALRKQQAHPPTACARCGTTFPYFKDKVYCSVKCRTDHRYETYIADWLAGTVSGNSGETDWVPTHIRRWLFEKNNHKCCKCGWAAIHPVTGNVPLTVNHIDGDSLNNRPENLELICPNCHSLTPNYCALNKGKGREQRQIQRQQNRAEGRLYCG